jgi:hypothetical protein
VENGRHSSGSTSHQQVFSSVAIEIEPGQCRTQLAQLARQERLELEIVEGRILMDMGQHGAGIGEETLDGFELRSQNRPG